MQIGRYRERVTIEAPAKTQDRTGDQRVIGWTDPRLRWARIQPLSPGAEALEGEQIVGRQAYLIAIRYTPELTPEHSITCRGVRTQVRSVQHPEPRGTETTAVCVETTPPPGSARR